jgi:hypothetical protein
MVCECGTDLTFEDFGECPVCGCTFDDDLSHPPDNGSLFDDPEAEGLEEELEECIDTLGSSS